MKRVNKTNMVKINQTAEKFKGPEIGKRMKTKPFNDERDVSPNPLQAVKRHMNSVQIFENNDEPVAESVDEDQIEKDTQDLYK